MKQDKTGLVETLNYLAAAYIDTGNYAEAVPVLEKCLRLISDPSSPFLVSTLSNLGTVHRFLGDLSTALKYTKEAHSVLIRIGYESPDLRLTYCKVLSNLGALYRLSRDFGEAKRALKEAFETCSALTDVPPHELGAVNLSLGLYYMDLNDYASAQPYLEKALELTRLSDPGEGSIQYAVQLNALADWNRATGRLAAALQLHEQVSDIYKLAYGEEHFNYATNLISLARLYQNMKRYKEAEASLRRAADILEASVGQTHTAYLDCLGSLGTVLAELRKYDEAETVIRRSLELTSESFGENDYRYAACLHNLVVLLPNLSENRLTYAFTEFINIDELRPTLQDTIDAFFDLTKEGHTKLQLIFLEKIAEIERNAGMESGSSYATTLSSLGQVHQLLGDMSKAEEYLRQSLEIERNLGQRQRPELALRLNALAYLLAATGRAGEALELMQEASLLENHLVGQVFTTGSEQQRLKYFVALRHNFHVFLSLVVRCLPETAGAIRAAFDLTLQRKALGIEALAAQRDALLSGKYPELAPNLRELQALRVRIAQKTLAGPGVEGEDYHLQLLSEWDERKEAIEVALARRIPEMSLEQQLKTADWRAVAGALSARMRLVEFVLFADYDFSDSSSTNRWKGGRYIAFVISPAEQAEIRLIDLGPALPIDRLIADFRAALIKAGTSRHLSGKSEPTTASPQQAVVYGQRLRELVFDPLLPAIDGADRIFLATDGDLTRLPFGALPLSRSGFLIDRYEISYLNSGRDLLRLNRAGGGRATGPLVVADPDFDYDTAARSTSGEPAVPNNYSCDLLRSNLYFTRLGGTRREGEEVARLLEISPLLDRSALEQSLKQASSPLILHIATHGFFLPNQEIEPAEGDLSQLVGGFFNRRIENPLLRSGLALAGANRTIKKEGGLPPEAEDGILTAEDVTAMDLSATELVVLSACETGLGELMVGEGVYGLQRAITLAGARTLVMSLWKVPDYQTQELMVEFYRRLLAGAPRAVALRQAQLDLKEKYPEPFYWAAFICQGDPSPLTN
jgi:CHAT domain-containing protein/Tfp pilus assembly protein PilF